MRRGEDEREAASRCGETCPAVDGAFSELWDDLERWIAPCGAEDAKSSVDKCCEAVKAKGTLLLRASLVEVCGELQQAQHEAQGLRLEIERLTALVDGWRADFKALEKEMEAING